MSRKPKLIDKKAKKNWENCYFCGESDYSLLDVHRIVEGKDGGRYVEHNSLSVCCRCHRLIHAGQIKIDKKYLSSSGWILHYWQDGEEFWK